MASNKDILNKAISHIGESGTNTWKAYNTNGTNWGTGWAWCCAFVWRVFKECGASNLFYGGGKTASVGVADDWFYKHCEWVKYDAMKAGDIVIFTWYPTGAGNSRSGREKSHIGIIEKRVDSNNFYAIEGNTGSPARVRRRLRSRKYIYAIYRPKYGAAAKKTYGGVFPTTNIKKGDNGTNVLRWQSFLYWWYSGMHADMDKGGKFCDGIYGDKTEAYTKRFKAAHVQPNGNVDEATINEARRVTK